MYITIYKTDCVIKQQLDYKINNVVKFVDLEEFAKTIFNSEIPEIIVCLNRFILDYKKCKKNEPDN